VQFCSILGVLAQLTVPPRHVLQEVQVLRQRIDEMADVLIEIRRLEALDKK